MLINTLAGLITLNFVLGAVVGVWSYKKYRKSRPKSGVIKNVGRRNWQEVDLADE